MGEETLNVYYSPYFTWVSSETESDWTNYETDFIDYNNGYQKSSAEDNSFSTNDTPLRLKGWVSEGRKCLKCDAQTRKCFFLCSNCFMVTRRSNMRRFRKNGFVHWILRGAPSCRCLHCRKARSAGVILHKKSGHIVSCFYTAQERLKTSKNCYICMKPYITIIKK